MHMNSSPKSADLGEARANPTKAFFVRMLTRDISIEDCILDLIDNSVDAAWETEGGGHPGLESSTRLSPFEIRLEIQPDSFSIKDNCGGLDLHTAKETAFNFGNTQLNAHTDSTLSVGVYGIGMKRAIFKLGAKAEIKSTYQASQELESFRVSIDTDKWLDDDSSTWGFPITSTPASSQTGLAIRVESLTAEVASVFSTDSFINTLRRTIARDYMLPLGHGLTIYVNGLEVEGAPMTLMESAEFAPFHETFQDNGVSYTIIAGMAEPPSQDSEPDNQSNRKTESGWNVFCNGRSVLNNDTTSASGWGTTGVPRWHPQYNGFKGYVFFTASNPALLPMTTTKRHVDESSLIYRKALGKMAGPAKTWVEYTNRRKERQSEAKNKESEATPAPISSLKKNKKLGVPKLGQKRVKMVNISFLKPLSEVQQLGATFGDSGMKYREVGLKAFELAYGLRVDEKGHQD